MQVPHIINLPKFEDSRGNLSFIEEFNHIPFKIERAFWIYDVPGGEKRGGHAYKQQQELIICLSGSFDVVLTDKNGLEIKYSLNRSYYGLYVPPLRWRHIENFSTNSLGLHISSSCFLEEDYIRNFEDYKNLLS
jgi:hypothetical protein